MSLLTPIYWMIGVLLAQVCVRILREGGEARWARSAFYGALAILFLVGDWLPVALAGALVLLIAVLAGFALPDRRAEIPAPRSLSISPRLLLPILAIPLLTLLLSLTLPRLHWDGAQPLAGQAGPLWALAIASVVGLALACTLTRESPWVAVERGGRLFEAIGWAVLLPLLLAVLGTLFGQVGVGTALASWLASWLPLDLPWVAIFAYGLGMALLTMAMGNAFAAFPVMAGGLALPFLIQAHGANPAPLAAIGMLCGYCGTLMTPMAANFNLVPVALLDLKDRHAVIRAQLPTALPLLGVNLILLGVLCLR